MYPWGKQKRRCYLHLYYNATNRAKDVDKFNEQLLQVQGVRSRSGKSVADHQEAYDDFLIQKTTPKRGLQVSFNSEAVSQYIKFYAGFQALVSNGIKDPVEAMRVYRDKDAVREVLRRPRRTRST